MTGLKTVEEVKASYKFEKADPKYWNSADGQLLCDYWHSKEGQEEIKEAKRRGKLGELKAFYVNIGGIKFSHKILENKRTVVAEVWTGAKGRTDSMGNPVTFKKVVCFDASFFNKLEKNLTFAKRIEKIFYHPKDQK